MMISWMSSEDDAKAFDKNCDKCKQKTANTTHGKPIPCVEHELEYANQQVTVIECHFLDGEDPQLGQNMVNDLIISPQDNIGWLIDHIDAEAYEGRDTVLQLKLKKMTRDELNTLPEWEP